MFDLFASVNKSTGLIQMKVTGPEVFVCLGGGLKVNLESAGLEAGSAVVYGVNMAIFGRGFDNPEVLISTGSRKYDMDMNDLPVQVSSSML